MDRMDQQRPRGEEEVGWEPVPPGALRRKAEDRLRGSEGRPAEVASEVDARALIHELQVHQIELEMQNDELQRAYVAAKEASENYYDLFDFAPVGYFLWDAKGRILEVNLAGAVLLGLNRKTTIETRFGQFVAEENRAAFADFCRRVLTTGTQQTCEVKLFGQGQPVYVLVEGIAAPDRQGQRKLCRAAVIDTTLKERAKELAAANRNLQSEIAARKQAEESLRESEERLRLALTAADIGTWHWDLVADRLEWSDRCKALFGLAAEHPLTYEVFQMRVHADDRQQVSEAVMGALNVKGEYDVEFRVVWPDGTVRCLASKGKTFCDAEGRAVRMEGVAFDVTERREAQEVFAQAFAEATTAKRSAEQAMAAAEHANRAKDDFLAVLSHELRTPLTPVVMGLSMLQDRPDFDPQVRETLEMVRRNVEFEARLIDDLLDVSRIARGRSSWPAAPSS